jgi:hypothetical protein
MADIQKEALDRLADARSQKARFAPDIQEAYFFAAPQKARKVTSTSAASTTQPKDDTELQTSIAIEETENFATTLLNSFMPEGVMWADQRPAVNIDEVLKKEVTGQCQSQRRKVFGLIWESNFYAEIGKALNPDAAVGTFGMLIDTKDLHGAVSNYAVPLREMEINIGPDGKVGDRFIVRYTKNRFVRSLIEKDARLSDKLSKTIADKPNGQASVTWGWWRDYSEAVETWQYVQLVNRELVYEKTLKGAGSCAFVVVTFNRHSEYPFGTGPLLKAAPDLRVLDEMSAAEVDNIDLSLRPPMTYPDDSFANVEDGVEPGAWYPIRNGTQDAVRKMYEPNRLDAVYFDQDRRERRVRRLFYNDFPQQRGDTPPTATQWLDEMALAQRKIGTPGVVFWEEGPGAFFTRFRFIALERGLIKEIEYPGQQGKIVSVVADNPTRRAQDQQEVSNAVRSIQIGAELFPEETKVAVDGAATLKNVIDKMGGKDVVVFRDQNQIAQATEMLTKLAGGAGGGELQPGSIGAPVPQ